MMASPQVNMDRHPEPLDLTKLNSNQELLTEERFTMLHDDACLLAHPLSLSLSLSLAHTLGARET